MQAPEKTNMTKDPARKKMVKLQFKRDTILKSGAMAIPGQVLELDEEEAKEILSFKSEGYYDFSGERTNDATRQRIVKAVIFREEDVA